MPDFGTLSFNIPYLFDENGNPSGTTQDYLNYYDSGVYNNLNNVGESPTYPYTGNTVFTGVTYYNAIGLSKISELKKYGVNEYSGVTINDNISGYTINGLSYNDHPEGFTMITGNTNGFTKEEIISLVLTRNEHLLGFVDEPAIYSDVFIERGKQSVMEMNFKLSEIDNIDELTNYGNGFFKVKKQ